MKNKVEVYPDELYNNMEIEKPKVGCKLNKKCLITFYDFIVPHNMKESDFVNVLKLSCKNQ